MSNEQFEATDFWDQAPPTQTDLMPGADVAQPAAVDLAQGQAPEADVATAQVDGEAGMAAAQTVGTEGAPMPLQPDAQGQPGQDAQASPEASDQASAVSTGQEGGESGLRQVSDDSTGAEAATGERQEPVVDVPEDAVEVTKDTTLADEKIATVPDGGVVDTRGEGTTITTRDGVEVRIDKNGQVHVDSDISNNADGKNPDRSDINGDGTFLTEDGTKITVDNGKVTVTQLDGQKFVATPDGRVKIDLEEDEDDSDSDKDGDEDKPGDADDKDSDDKDDKEPEEPETPSGGGSGGGNPGGGSSGGGTGGGSSGGNTGGGDTGNGGSSTTDDGGKDDTGGKDGKDGKGGGKDFEYELRDLKEDAETYRELARRANQIGMLFQSFKGKIDPWGLWTKAQGPYEQALERCHDIYSNQANTELGKMSDGLNDTASEYEATENENTATAGTATGH